MTNDEFTNKTFSLQVGDGHKLHVVDWGNPKAKTPFIYLNGGPGGCISDKGKVCFDPKRDRVIFYDQRGCGESTPYGSLKNNTTASLAEDIIKIADHLKIDKFNLYGFSWGSTLALYTAINYPNRVNNLIIGGIYTGSNDMPEMFSYLSTFFPEVHEQILADTPAEHHKNLTEYYQDKALNGTPSEQKRACHILNTIEGTIMNYDADFRPAEPYANFDPVPAKIETHFIANNCFIPKGYIIKNAHKITAKTYIIQGRADLVCPPAAAYRISKLIPDAKIYWSKSNHASEREQFSLIRTILSLI